MSIDLRVVKTRETIQTQMIRLLETVPFEKITVNQLILACRINRSTFYRNYEDKYDLIRKICQDQLDEFQNALRLDFIALPVLNEETGREAFLPLLKAGTDVLIAFDWTPIIASMQSVAEKVTSLVGTIGSLVSWAQKLSPLLVLIFGPKLIAMIGAAIKTTRLYAGALTFVERAHLASGAAANYQLTATGLLSTAMYTASTAAKTLGASMKAAFLSVLLLVRLM